MSQLKKMPQNYSGFILTDEYPTFDAYIEKISSIGEWGENCTLQAAADAFGATIYVFSIAYPDGVIAIPPSSRSTRVCYISHWAEVHYNSVYHKVD
ncbi:OVARIAN TUMOR DOMAIN-containing deubiquitinating enzyme 10-like [Rosa chinensis]|uniref:OVARIAN TUMOR DOMAIN-containing deubiquitinating enzyme 10-like n=1 Tax=Rosa chinensis TaxID=74649 RepID=UPI001AD8ADA6|nr:OVARIAN TUMOR DOMAIN-containing deubiquitinating enzyme 10-like [Rosa chinensis]XP_040364620.1 OVARIAN TUMOR DOMAIN-containing deubiquitinating enzyme 10-like [Rosa chinensis]